MGNDKTTPPTDLPIEVEPLDLSQMPGGVTYIPNTFLEEYAEMGLTEKQAMWVIRVFSQAYHQDTTG